MNDPHAVYATYDDERLHHACQEAAARITRAEHCLERAAARHQQAEAAHARVRSLLARAQGDLRLLQAILQEKEDCFAEGELEREEESESRGTVLSSSPCPVPHPGTASTTGPLPPCFLYRELSR